MCPLIDYKSCGSTSAELFKSITYILDLKLVSTEDWYSLMECGYRGKCPERESVD